MNDDDINWNLVIGENGKLMTKNSNSLKYKEVVGMRPAFDVNSEEGYVMFLAEITDRKYCEAIVFTFTY